MENKNLFGSLLFERVSLIEKGLTGFFFSLHSCSDIPYFHSRGRDHHCPVGPLGSLWLLGADHPPSSGDLCGKAGVLGGENCPGSLAFRSDRDRQECNCRHHGGSAVGTGSGVCSVESAQIRLWKAFFSGQPTEEPGGPFKSGGEEERRVVMRRGEEEIWW